MIRRMWAARPSLVEALIGVFVLIVVHLVTDVSVVLVAGIVVVLFLACMAFLAWRNPDPGEGHG